MHEGDDKTFAIVFDTGDEVVEGLLAFAREQSLAANHLTGISAYERVTLGFFELGSRDYKKIPINEQVEVMSLIGNICLGMHLRGMGRQMGGLYVALFNWLEGPLAFAPALFTGFAGIGLIAIYLL
jgi:hypothetical protein